jgi:beta-1,4-mannosyl-glycoprotein beta-1,4-N-acetylglucosaminyltransferase
MGRDEIKHLELSTGDDIRDNSLPLPQDQRRQYLIIGLVVLIVFFLGYFFTREKPRGTGTFDFLPLSEAQMHCTGYHMNPYPNRGTHRKIYDLFIINTELDWLEIRLEELWDYVDYFIITESAITFTNVPKPLVVRENWDLFKKYHSKMVLFTVDFTGANVTTPWEREYFQRNAMYDQVFPTFKGPQIPQEGDVIIISDVDEIPTREAVKTLRNCDVATKVSLRAQAFYYSFQYKLNRENGYYPHATTYQGDKTISPVELRTSGSYMQIWNGAWHCSYCFKNINDIVEKINFFSHQEFNIPRFTDRAKILWRVRNGYDLFDRSSDTYALVPFNNDIPEYIKENPYKFKYLINRDPEDGNFADFVESDAHPTFR